MAKLRKGKTTKQQKIIDVAFQDAALVAVFQQEEAAKQQAIMDTKIRLRREKKEREAKEREEKARANVTRWQAAAAVAQAHWLAGCPGLWPVG